MVNRSCETRKQYSLHLFRVFEEVRVDLVSLFGGSFRGTPARHDGMKQKESNEVGTAVHALARCMAAF